MTEKPNVVIKCILEGEHAKMYRELKKRGLIRHASDVMTHGVMHLYDEALERDMKRVQVTAAERLQR